MNPKRHSLLSSRIRCDSNVYPDQRENRQVTGSLLVGVCRGILETWIKKERGSKTTLICLRRVGVSRLGETGTWSVSSVDLAYQRPRISAHTLVRTHRLHHEARATTLCYHGFPTARTRAIRYRARAEAWRLLCQERTSRRVFACRAATSAATTADDAREYRRRYRVLAPPAESSTLAGTRVNDTTRR